MTNNTPDVFALVFETAALELGVPVEMVQKVFTQGQVQFTSRKIAEGGLETVMWPYLGKFRPKFKKIYHDHKNFASRQVKSVTKQPK